jgi:HNH endonuclease/AP2 domain-containing protein
MSVQEYTPKRQPRQLANGTIEILLTRNQVNIIDSIDADLAQMNWCAARSKLYTHQDVYIARRTVTINGKRVFAWIHRVILERIIGRPLLSTEQVDHVDNNPMNNCRSNLRLATATQNQANKRKGKNNKSGYKGVYFNKSAGKWQAQVKSKGKKFYAGTFLTPELAYVAYCEKAKEIFGEFFNPG